MLDINLIYNKLIISDKFIKFSNILFFLNQILQQKRKLIESLFFNKTVKFVYLKKLKSKNSRKFIKKLVLIAKNLSFLKII